MPTNDANLLRLTSGPRSRSYADVVARLGALEGAMSETDGLRSFTRLYRAMTAAVAAHKPRDPAFLETLDCIFAQLYFDALQQYLTGGATPRAWLPLFEARWNTGLLPLQLALAGVNAHINRDLPVALVVAFAAAGGEPDRVSARFADYRDINSILEAVQAAEKPALLTGCLADADLALGRVDDLLALWSLERARDAAWTTGELRWHIREIAFLSDEHLRSVDRLVGFAGRGLLRPLATPLDLERRTAPRFDAAF
jgi:hypothetical protein